MERGSVLWLTVVLIAHLSTSATTYNFTDVNLPQGHLSYYLNSFPAIADECRSDSLCPFKVTRIYYTTTSLLLPPKSLYNIYTL